MYFVCLQCVYVLCRFNPFLSIPSGCSCRTLSRCQFNSHSRRGVHGERIEPRVESQRVLRLERKKWTDCSPRSFSVMDVGMRRQRGMHLPPILSFVRRRVIISRRTKNTHYRDINSTLVPLSLRPFYQILP